MSDNYTPMTSRVKAVYEGYTYANGFDSLEEAGSQFDRWHAAEIRRAKAEAWDEGAKACDRDWMLAFDIVTPDEDREPWPNPYRDPS